MMRLKIFFQLKRTALCLLLLSLAAGSTFFSFSFAEPNDGEPSGPITSEAFIGSDAGQNFLKGDYERALAAIEELLNKHPKDSLLIRYKAIALDRLGKSDEAARLFSDLLLENSLHVPTHFFLAQAYANAGKNDAAAKEFTWVLENGRETPYGEWSATALENLNARKIPAAAPGPKRWYTSLQYGYEYDSNVILRPDDESLASSRDHNAGRQTVDFTLRYRVLSKRDLSVDLIYAMSQSIHDDSLDEFNFHSEDFGVQLRKRVQIGNQDVVAGLRYDVLIGFLEDDLFSVRNRWHLSADTRFTERTRTVFYDRIAVADFGPDGFLPSTTSRDGLYNEAGVTHYLYSEDFKKHIYIREEFVTNDTRGKNFDSLGVDSRLGIHTPVIGNLELDGSVGLQLRFYPRFSSISSADNSRRRDRVWDVYSALTYRFTSELSLQGFYRYIYSFNQNNFFDSTRHIGGANLTYSRSF